MTDLLSFDASNTLGRRTILSEQRSSRDTGERRRSKYPLTSMLLQWFIFTDTAYSQDYVYCARLQVKKEEHTVKN